MHNGEKEQIRRLLIKDVAKLAELYGLNHWRVILRKALAESEEFFDRSQ
jgi:hypothetical protein